MTQGPATGVTSEDEHILLARLHGGCSLESLSSELASADHLSLLSCRPHEDG